MEMSLLEDGTDRCVRTEEGALHTPDTLTDSRPEGDSPKEVKDCESGDGHADRWENSHATVPALAYLGDSVLEVCVRTYLVQERGLSTSAHLNREALSFVRASAQSEAMRRIEPFLSEEEAIVYRRGRNIGHTNTPRSASVAEYRRATGMEALFGYLSLCGRRTRVEQLFRLAYGLDEAKSREGMDSPDTDRNW